MKLPGGTLSRVSQPRIAWKVLPRARQGYRKFYKWRINRRTAIAIAIGALSMADFRLPTIRCVIENSYDRRCHVTIS